MGLASAACHVHRAINLSRSSSEHDNGGCKTKLLSSRFSVPHIEEISVDPKPSKRETYTAMEGILSAR